MSNQKQAITQMIKDGFMKDKEPTYAMRNGVHGIAFYEDGWQFISYDEITKDVDN